MECYLFGIVLVGLLVGFPLGVFLLMVMFEVTGWSCSVAWPCVGGSRVLCGRRFLGGVRRISLHRKTPAHPAGYGRDGGFQSRPKVRKRLRVAESPRFRHIGAKAPRLHLILSTM